MKILVLADEESKSLWDYYSPDKLEGLDLIISCGDLSTEYLEFLVTMGRCPVLYVPGNHDTEYVKNPPQGCINLDENVYVYKGLRFFGLGGSMKYKKGPYMFSEYQMRHKILRSRWKLVKNRGFDVLVAHAPIRDFGDMSDLPHRGYECFSTLLDICHPAYMLHGHVHASYMAGFKREKKHPSGTIVVNGFEKYVLDTGHTVRKDMRRFELWKKLWKKMIF